MSEQKKGGKYLAKRKKKKVAGGYAAPFFAVLFVLTVVSFIIPLRPTRSENEKRALAEFPAFSWEALTSGSYFDDINLWFSDTYPGRDSWISLSAATKDLHGIQDVKIYGDVSSQETVPEEYVPIFIETRPPAPEVTEPPVTEGTLPEGTLPPETEPPMTEPEETVAPPTNPVEEWGGVDAGSAEVYLGNVIQIGDTAFNYLRFSQYESERFINTMNWLQEDMAGKEDVDIVTVAIPGGVGVMVEPEYQQKLDCADQQQIIDYLYSGISDEIVKVDIFDKLVSHNNEYLYFRTDHHWTAQGAYYCYEEICKSLGMEPTPLEDFEELDMGTFRGTNYYKCNQSSQLKLDNVYAYRPYGDITMMISNENGRFSQPMITDMSRSKENAKYMTFLAGDHPLCEITNNDLPDGPTCVIIKDSYGNPVAPFFSTNYHKVYVVDFREYKRMNIQEFVDAYEVDDVIFLVQLLTIQNATYNNLIRGICGV